MEGIDGAFGGGGESQNWSSFVSVTTVWPQNGLKLLPIQLLEAIIFILIIKPPSQIHSDCVENNPQLLPTPLMTKTEHVLLLVGT